jgi:hypothetical protein
MFYERELEQFTLRNKESEEIRNNTRKYYDEDKIYVDKNCI